MLLFAHRLLRQLCDTACYSISSTKENFGNEKDLLKGLTDEQIAKVKECENNEELLVLAKEEGVELNDEQLSAITGGCHTSTCEQIEIDQMQCPVCLNWYCMEKVSEVWFRCKYCCKITINKNLEK